LGSHEKLHTHTDTMHKHNENTHKALYSPQADGSVIEAEIVSSVFFDPKGERQNV